MSRSPSAATTVLLVAGAVGLALGLAGPAGAAGAPPAVASRARAGAVSAAGSRIVLVGASDLGWSAVGAGTPTLTALVSDARRGLAGSAVGSLSVRSAETPTCPVDGWSTLAAGVRAAGPARPDGRCPALPTVVGRSARGAAVAATPRPVRVLDWPALSRSDSGDAYRAHLGTLAGAVARAHRCLTAVGPGAAVAGASSAGVLDRYLPDVADLDATDLAACPLTLVDAGSGATAADHAVAEVLDEAPAGTTVVLATIADGAAGGRPVPSLGLIAELTARGPGPHPGDGSAATADHLLTSDSTDWPGVAALTDLTPTLLTGAAVPLPTELTGAVIVAGPGAVPDVAALTSIAVRARVAGAQVENWFTVAGLAAVALVLALAVRARWPTRWPAHADRVVQLVAATVFCLPVSTRLASLVPWWRGGTAQAQAWALWGAQVGSALVLSLLALLAAQATRQHRRAAAVVAIVAFVSTAVVVLDVATDSPLSRLAVIGLLPIDGSRFHGLGNEIVAAVDTAVLLGASIAVGPLVRRRQQLLAGWLLAAAGLCFAVVDGLPGLGDDFGGVPADVVGAGVAALVVAGSRLRPLRLLAVGAAAVLLAAGLALADAARGAGHRTHVGDFVVSLAHGTAGPLLTRKAGSVVGPFAGDNGPIAALAVWFGLVVVIGLGVYVLRPGADTGLLGGLDRPWPAWRAGLAGAGAAAIVGAALNDSGIIVALVATGTAVAAVAAVLTGAAADHRTGDPAR